MSASMRTISDNVILRELEEIKSNTDAKIQGLEEVNKLWFHTISQQIRDTNKKNDPERNDAELQGIAELLASILDNQEKIIKQNNDNYAKLQSGIDKLLKNSSAYDAIPSKPNVAGNPRNKSMTPIKKSIVVLVILAIVAFAGIKGYDYISRAPEGQVYIAPLSGTRYHTYRNCKSLKKASRIELIELDDALEHYTPCGYCEQKGGL